MTNATSLRHMSWPQFMSLPFAERERLFLADPGTLALQRRLLSVGGSRVVPMPEPNAADLLERGEALRYDGRFRFMRDAEPHGCHGNAARAWLRWRLRGFRIVTGWMLGDGVWYQHTWGEQRGVCVESNGGRNAIRYGLRLDERESLGFCLGNLPFDSLVPTLDKDENLRGLLAGIVEEHMKSRVAAVQPAREAA
jgi:hypothetical protein